VAASEPLAPPLVPARARSTDPLAAPDDVALPPPEASRTASGIAYRNLSAGSGKEHPAAADNVTVHYTGWTADGRMFDSSRDGAGKPASFDLDRVIPGWTEAVQLMLVGDKTRFWIPAELAYGHEPTRRDAPAGQLTFDIELIELEKLPVAPEVPIDVKRPPPAARRTKSGLRFQSLSKGTGNRHPKADSEVEVHYSGWTTDGKLFDSSRTRGQSARFLLKAVIKGWTEGVQLMVEGETMRLWIPADLAYGDKAGSGRPTGTLVFDIELIKIL